MNTECGNCQRHISCQKYYKFLDTWCQTKSKLHHFDPSFPYIHHLPCLGLYNLWNSQKQLINPVPVYNIFHHILQCLYGTMTTYAQMNNNIADDENESIYVFYSLMSQAKQILDDEKKKVTACEKKRHFQEKKRKRNSEKTKSYNPQTWMFHFLFLPNYYVTVGINWGNDNYNCAN
jgi:hypothetical protein